MNTELLLTSLPDHLRYRDELKALRHGTHVPDIEWIRQCFEAMPQHLRKDLKWEDVVLRAAGTARQLSVLPQVQFFSRWSENFPRRLLYIADSPWGLFARGEPQVMQNPCTLAVVGTRRPNLYGTQVVEHLLGALDGSQYTLVSGLAYGIDSTAHGIALRAGAPNIAVLAHGIDYIYPPGSESLGHAILRHGGALVSEHPPGEAPYKWRFTFRNRLVSGLSHGLWVVQGGPRSGTRSTATHAAEQGRALGATPGSIFSELSAVPHEILRMGGTPIADVVDLRQFLGLAAPCRTPALLAQR